MWKRCGKPVDNMWKKREFSTAFHKRIETRKRGGGKPWQLSTFLPQFFPPDKSLSAKEMSVVIPTFHIPITTTSFIYKINSRLSSGGKLFQAPKETWEIKQENAIMKWMKGNDPDHSFQQGIHQNIKHP